MATALPGTAFPPSSFIRLLADLADARPAPPAAGPAPGLADTLDGWLDWTDAIALSAALNTGAAAPAAAEKASNTASDPGSDSAKADDDAALRQAVAQVRDALLQAIASDPALGAAQPARRAPNRGPAVVAGPDDDPVARLQRCHVKHQRLMDAQLGPLRARVRATLAQRTPALARLAALDAVMDQALSVRERHLLGQVPGLVARPAQRQLAKPPGTQPAAAGPETLKRLQARWQALMLAELDSRMQAIEGLLEALQHAGRAVPALT